MSRTYAGAVRVDRRRHVSRAAPRVTCGITCHLRRHVSRAAPRVTCGATCHVRCHVSRAAPRVTVTPRCRTAPRNWCEAGQCRRLANRHGVVCRNPDLLLARDVPLKGDWGGGGVTGVIEPGETGMVILDHRERKERKEKRKKENER